MLRHDNSPRVEASRVQASRALALAVLLASAPAALQVVDDQKLSASDGLPLIFDDAFGSAVATLGDQDGDGNVEVAVGVPLSGLDIFQTGAVRIASVAPDGSLADERLIDEGSSGFDGVLDLDDEFGCAVAAFGDVDGDGIGDLAVGARFDDDGQTNAGAVWILRMRADGRVKGHQKISATAGDGPATLIQQARFGEGLCGLGDLDGDGVPDLAVAQPVGTIFDPAGIWILFLENDGTVKNFSFIPSGAGTPLFGVGILNEFATSMALLDNTPNATSIVLVASEEDGGPGQEGSVWRMLIDRTGALVTVKEIGEGLAGFPFDLDPGDAFGEAIAAVDLNGDGSKDLVVGAPGDDTAGTDEGSLWFLNLFATGDVLRAEQVAQGIGGFTGPTAAGDGFGTALANAGDLDGDGSDDLWVGAPGDDDGGTDAGALHRLLREEPCPTYATTTPRFGSGLNAQILVSRNNPRLGGDWQVDLDCSGHAASVGAVVAYEGTLEGVFLPGGELLVDVTSPYAAGLLLAHNGNTLTFTIPIPNDVAFCGFTGSMQGVVLGAPLYELSNALDAVLGD